MSGIPEALFAWTNASADDFRNGKPILVKYQRTLLHNEGALQTLRRGIEDQERKGDLELVSSIALFYCVLCDANAYGIDQAYEGAEAFLRLMRVPLPLPLLAPGA